MDSFQAHRVEESCCVSYNHSAVEVVLRQCPVAALGNRLGAIGVKRPSLKNAPYIRMCFELLEPLVRIEPGIQVIETDDKSYRNPPVCHVVDETAAEFLIAQRPTHGVNHTAAPVLFLGHIPNFFHAGGKDLRVAFFVQVEPLDQLFCERTT